MNNRLIFISLSILIVAFSRLLPHPLNVTPIAAIALFGGAMFNNRTLAFAVPLAAMLVSDIFLGFHNTMLSVYTAFALTVLIGFAVKNEKSPVKLAIASISGSVLFFMITNFAVWFGDVYYTQDVNGLLTCYAAGVPFFRNSLLGDLFFNAVLFGGYHVVSAKFPKLTAAQ